jgi:hypothetical protein
LNDCTSSKEALGIITIYFLIIILLHYTGSVIGVPDHTIQVNDVYSHACKVQGTTMEKSEEGSACPCKIVPVGNNFRRQA